MKITNNFTKEEFQAKDGATMPDDVFENVKVLAENLQVLRDLICRPIIVNSGYRTPGHNAEVGGAPMSKHLNGMGADITVNGYSEGEIFDLIEGLIRDGKMQEGGLGLYAAHVHYDVRGYPARW